MSSTHNRPLSTTIATNGVLKKLRRGRDFGKWKFENGKWD